MLPPASLDARATTPTAEDRYIRSRTQEKHARQTWFFIACVLAFFAVVRLSRLVYVRLFWRKPRIGQHEKRDEEKAAAVESRLGATASFSRLPNAIVAAFRILAFRLRIPYACVSISEFSFITGYIVAMLIWLLVDTRDLVTMFWQDRAAHLASIQLPLVVALAGKNSFISFLTGIGHEKLNVLHRAAARTCLLLLWMHAIARTASGLPARFDFSHNWMRSGAVGLTALSLAGFLSISPIRHLAYEFFIVSHVVLIMIFLVCGYFHAHDPGLVLIHISYLYTEQQVSYGYYIWPALVIWGFDRSLRFARVMYNNRIWNRRVSHYSMAKAELLSEDTVRLTFLRRFNWRPGQHAYLTIPSISTIPTEAHPFTIASIPERDGNEDASIVFLIRRRSGFTGRLRDYVAQHGSCSLPAYIDGPYGCPPDLKAFSTCILIAGGSGVSYTLPLLLHLIRENCSGGDSAMQRVVFVWAVRDSTHLKWISRVLTDSLSRVTPSLAIEPRVYITGSTYQIPEVPTLTSTGDKSPTDEKDNDIVETELPLYSSLKLIHGRPSIKKILQDEISISPGSVSVNVAGPSSMTNSVRKALRSKFAGPAAAFRGAPSVSLHVEAFVLRVVPQSPDVFYLFQQSPRMSGLSGDDRLRPSEHDNSVMTNRPPSPRNHVAITQPLHSEYESNNEEEDEEFVYPVANTSGVEHKGGEEEEESEFVYPAPVMEPEQGLTMSPAPPPQSSHLTDSSLPSTSGASSLFPLSPPPLLASLPPPPEDNQPQPRVPPSSALLEFIYASALSGDLLSLKLSFTKAVEEENVESFSLANGASPRTGYTALHAAASRGHLDTVSWLIEDCGAMPDLEDREGETALHKAALNGHISVVSYLVPGKADVHVKDGDGWTALHNACSKGYLDIVRYLCEQGGAAQRPNGLREIDVRSRDGWTPLMNAASKGHLPVVRYLLSKQRANPLVRNNWGETAYDAAAAVFEVWICEVLQQAEAERWRGSSVPYNPLAVHTTIPLILYENQRLDTRLKTVAVSGGCPKFSASGLGKHGRRAPFELKFLEPLEDTGVREVAAWRSGVQLPFLNAPWSLPKPGTSSAQGYTGIGNDERSHFWLSDWTLDVTHPGVDAEEGWQYAHSFDDPDDRWTAEKPPQLQRLLTSSGLVTGGFRGSTSLAGSSPSSSRSLQMWVRRRRWVRIMRRRLDIPPLPFLEPDAATYFFDAEGNPIPYIEESHGDDEELGRELGTMPPSFLSSSRDFVARARYLAGNTVEGDNTAAISAVDARRAIAKLERATAELRQGILASEDGDRKTQAEVLLNAYSRELERRRLAAGAQGLLITGMNDDEIEDDDTESFHYPDTNEAPNEASSSSRPHNTPTRAPTDLTPHLSQAPDFRVPTHEAPQKVIAPRWTSTTQPHIHWERDEAVHQCRDCQRRFTFLNRRVSDKSTLTFTKTYHNQASLSTVWAHIL
ncbi:hypothetical protein AX16_000165 [Volvariella volvacea WC 439]|nr:hypothetical protein AX16_000165 [Volvariella volvacea WC 439]